MKQRPLILILLLALLMQLRVAYGCALPSDLAGTGCDRHALVALPAGAPADDEGGCRAGIDLASRALRADEDGGQLPAGGAGGASPDALLDSQPALRPAAAKWRLAVARPLPTDAPASAGALTYLVTARLRL